VSSETSKLLINDHTSTPEDTSGEQGIDSLRDVALLAPTGSPATAAHCNSADKFLPHIHICKNPEPVSWQYSARPPHLDWKEHASPVHVDDPIGSAKIFDMSGNEVKREPGQTLKPGDYTIEFGDQRDFYVHIPTNANGSTMYVLQGAMEPKWVQQDYVSETQMNKEADKYGFTTVFPHPLKHFLGKYNREAAYAYNAPDSLINPDNLSQAGYNDNLYLDNVRKILPQITTVNSSADRTAAISFSQSTPFLRQYAILHPEFSNTLGFIGAGFPEGKLPPLPNKNSLYVLDVNELADKNVMPKHDGTESYRYRLGQAIRGTVDFTGIGQSMSENLDPLSAVRNDKIQDSGPVLKQILSPGYVTDPARPLPGGISRDDVVISMHDSKGNRFDQINLPKAAHAYPSDNPEHKQTSAAMSYNAPISPYFAEQFVNRMRAK
jgi:hypothetical protein